MKTTVLIQNWAIGSAPSVLKEIHRKGVNISIYERDISILEDEVAKLVEQDVNFKSSGDIDTILSEIKKVIDLDEFDMMFKDIESLLHLFKKITASDTLRFLLTIVDTNMCKRFHTDVNDLRMLCTYSGPGTLWLSADNVDRVALNAYGKNEAIVIDENNINQTETGSVIVLKGAKYQQESTNAVVHRSPAIEENGEKRLLLRIDTDEFLNI